MESMFVCLTSVINMHGPDNAKFYGYSAVDYGVD